MALTDEQYKQLFRYVDGAMDAEEQKAFQDSLLHNKILNDESEFYKEIQLLIKSVEQKTGNTIPLLSGEKKSKNEQVWTIISEARRNWESKYEHDLKLKYGITDKEKKISGDGQKNKIKRIPKWVVAAALVGIALSGAFWWYYEDRKSESKVSINTKEASSAVTEDKITDSPESIINKQPTLPQENASPESITKTKEIKENKNRVVKQPIKKNFNLQAEKREALFASNFQPDATPTDADNRLRRAFAFYDTREYDSALLAFEKSETLITRGVDENKERRKFYTDYYKALSYLAIDSIARAIPHLRTAVTISPDILWKSKAQWYLALAYFKTGDIKETERLLNHLSIEAAAGEYKKKSLVLMNELNKEY